VILFKVKGVLRSTNETYCCLGVLCEIHPEVVRDGQAYVYKSARERTLLPNALMEDVGLSCNEMSELARKNDFYGYSFDQIADYIETNL
jgi:hypothetical protein